MSKNINTETYGEGRKSIYWYAVRMGLTAYEFDFVKRLLRNKKGEQQLDKKKSEVVWGMSNDDRNQPKTAPLLFRLFGRHRVPCGKRKFERLRAEMISEYGIRQLSTKDFLLHIISYNPNLKVKKGTLRLLRDYADELKAASIHD